MPVHALVVCAPFIHSFDEDLVAAQRLEVPDGAAAGHVAQDEPLYVPAGHNSVRQKDKGQRHLLGSTRHHDNACD